MKSQGVLKVRGAAAALAFALAGCVENEEEVVVAADGQLEVRMSAEGDADDLATGYALGFDGPWRPADDVTRIWARTVGDTGSQRSAQRVAAGVWPEDERPRLTVVASFASAADMPRWLAPEGEAYRDAYLARDTELEIEQRGSATVYTFVRTYPARRWADRRVLGDLEERVPAEIVARMEQNEPLTDADWQVLAPLVAGDYERSALSFAREALGAVFVEGEANLAATTVEGALEAVSAAVRARIDEPKLREIYAALVDPERTEPIEGDLRLDPDAIVRDALRGALATALDAAGTGAATRNAIFERLEQAFTAFDATADLQDESFSVTVAMPGTVIDGTFEQLEGSRATWEFKGEELADRELVLRVVSIIE